MALAPQSMPPQTPKFGGAAPAPAPQQAAPAGPAAKPVTHGLVDWKDIDERISSMPREAQAAIVQAVVTIPNLPTIFGIAIGPEAHDYFVQMQQAVKQSQQNSPQGADASQGQNTPASAPAAPAGGPPAMATSAGPQG